MKNPFVAMIYQGKPAVYDKDTAVFYYGFKSLNAARAKALALNEGK